MMKQEHRPQLLKGCQVEQDPLARITVTGLQAGEKTGAVQRMRFSSQFFPNTLEF